MMCALHDLADQDDVRVRFLCVPDEESEDIDPRVDRRAGARGLRRRLRDHRRADRPARRHPGQGRARVPPARPRPRRPRLDAVARRQRGPEGDRRLPANRVHAVLARVLGDVRPPVDQPRAGSIGGDALNKVPDLCAMVVDIRYLPNQDPGDILEQIRSIPDIEVVRTFISRARVRVALEPVRASRCATPSGGRPSGESMSVGRDGASDAVSFLTPACPPSSSGPPARATTARRSGSRSARWPATARRWCDFVARLPARWPSGRERRAARRRGRRWREPRARRARPSRGPRAAAGAALLAGVLDRARDGRRGVGHGAAARSTTSIDIIASARAAPTIEIPEIDTRRRRQAADADDPRLRPALRRTRRRA